MKVRIINQNPAKVAERQLRARLALAKQEKPVWHTIACRWPSPGGTVAVVDDAGRGEADYCGRAGCL